MLFTFDDTKAKMKTESEGSYIMNFEKWIIAHFSPTGGTRKVADATRTAGDDGNLIPEHRKTPANWRESDSFNLAADMLQHFAVGLHGLGQILHDLHIQNTSK